MSFEVEHEKFLAFHRKRRRGKRLYHLKEGHGHAEMMFLRKIWWPLFHEFEGIHPQYEVFDFKDGLRYLDFAYVNRLKKICFEIDGYGPHWSNMSREEFADDRVRQNDLVLDGWLVIRFAYDQVVHRPREVQQTVRYVMGKVAGATSQGELSLVEREIIRFGLWCNGLIGMKKVCEHLQMADKTVRKSLKSLMDKELLIAVGGPQRVHQYRIVYENVRKYYI